MTEPVSQQEISVVYSFESRWDTILRSGAVNVFFRKRRPRVVPKLVFFYVGSPIKAIVGYADVVSITEVNLEEARNLSSHASIGDEELKSYITQNGKVHAIKIGAPTVFEKGHDYHQLKRERNFNAPQSFLILDKEFERHLLGTQ